MTRSTHRGVAAIEFALTVPILLLVLGGIIELGLLVSFHQVIGRAARDGARVGSVTIEGSTPTGDLIEAEAIKQAKFTLETMGYPCVGTCKVVADWHLRPDNYRYVTVTVTYPFSSITHLLPFLDDVDPAASFTMLTQQQDEAEI